MEENEIIEESFDGSDAAASDPEETEEIQTELSQDNISTLINLLENMQDETETETETDILESEESTTESVDYTKLIYEILTEEETTTEEYTIMDKPISEYSVSESLMLVVVLCLVATGIYFAVKRGCGKWK